MREHTLNVHPRPQLTRDRWVDLGGVWGFAYDDRDQGLAAAWYRQAEVFDRAITVPFPPESSASGIGDTSFHPVVWYRRTFTSPELAAGDRLLLHCGAVDYRAHVWLNGQPVATHEGGHTPFSADITGALREQGEQVLVIRAEDLPGDLAQPRGKQDWQAEPHSIFYHRTTGIWQPVWLEPVAATHITDARWTPDLDHALIGLALTLQRDDVSPLQVRVQLRLHGDLLADDRYLLQGAETRRTIALDARAIRGAPHRFLWSPEHPNLIEVTLTVLDGETVVDEVQSYFGLRSATVDHGRFLLNGSPYYLRLALEQGYWPESHLAAPSVEAMRREVELTKELGFNGVRIHQKVEDPRFLYWCDRLGLLVWGEMANAYVYSPTAVERLTREWLEVLARDYSHPCIVAWVPLNESWGVPALLREPAQRHYVQSLYHLTKAIDPTRPVIDNDGWEHLISDICGIHDYAFSGATLRARYGSPSAIAQSLTVAQPQRHVLWLEGACPEGSPVMITEFGGISYRPAPGEPWFGYGTVTDQATYLAKYAEVVGAILDCPQVSGFCYTQLTDTLQETNGLLTERREPKLDMEQVRAITSRAVAAVPPSDPPN